MLNFLVVEDNVIQCKQLINYISEEIPDIRLYCMAHTGKEALKIIDQKNVDIILLDLNLPDISGVDIIKKITNKNIEKYKKSIILISGDARMLLETIKSPYVYTYFTKPANLSNISKCINEIIKQKRNFSNEELILHKISKELNTLHFNFSYVGTKYLKECIFETYKKGDKELTNLSKDIYPIIAKRYNKSSNNIHTNIKQAVKAMYYDCEESLLNKYFNYDYCIKPRVKEIILTILNKL